MCALVWREGERSARLGRESDDAEIMRAGIVERIYSRNRNIKGLGDPGIKQRTRLGNSWPSTVSRSWESSGTDGRIESTESKALSEDVRKNFRISVEFGSRTRGRIRRSGNARRKIRLSEQESVIEPPKFADSLGKREGSERFKQACGGMSFLGEEIRERTERWNDRCGCSSSKLHSLAIVSQRPSPCENWGDRGEETTLKRRAARAVGSAVLLVSNQDTYIRGAVGEAASDAGKGGLQQPEHQRGTL
ncbi:hypothetical protein FB451DRAFT_1180503 [Mycena latifolia]|nr:hypothetical protein FB451DRAFT_1180503 [Mycena latifolia]